MDALIIRKPWIDYILDGKKTWEIRGCNTKKRGKIELIQSKFGFIIGCCELVDCIKLNIEQYLNSKEKHCIENIDKLPYKSTYAWVLTNPYRYSVPKKYKHPNGAVIWVKV